MNDQKVLMDMIIDIASASIEYNLQHFLQRLFQ